MSKVLNRKKWLSLEEAARYFSAALGEPVNVTDVLYFILYDELACSAIFRKTQSCFITHQTCFPFCFYNNNSLAAELFQARSDDKYLSKKYSITGSFPENLHYWDWPDNNVIDGVYDLLLTERTRSHLYSIYNGGDETNYTLEGFFIRDESGRELKIFSGIWHCDISYRDFLKLVLLQGDERNKLKLDVAESLCDAVLTRLDLDEEEEEERREELKENFKWALGGFEYGWEDPYAPIERIIMENGAEKLLQKMPSKQDLVIQQKYARLFLDKLLSEPQKRQVAVKKRKHTSELLEILDAATEEFWEDKDPDVAYKIATNENVKNWILENHPDVSEGEAFAIARVMRPKKYK